MLFPVYIPSIVKRHLTIHKNQPHVVLIRHDGPWNAKVPVEAPPRKCSKIWVCKSTVASTSMPLSCTCNFSQVHSELFREFALCPYCDLRVLFIVGDFCLHTCKNCRTLCHCLPCSDSQSKTQKIFDFLVAYRGN